MRKLAILSACLAAALGASFDAADAGSLLLRSAAVTAAAPKYLDDEFFGFHNQAPTDWLSYQADSNTFTTARLIFASGDAVGCRTNAGTPYIGCGIDQWTYYEKTQGTYDDELIPLFATQFKARGISKVIMAYFNPPAWALRGNRYEVVANIPVGSPATISAPSNVLQNGYRMMFVCGVGTALPSPLACGTSYWVVNRTSSTIQLSATSGGAAINTSGTGSTGSSLVLRQSIPGNLAALKSYVQDVIKKWVANGIQVYAYEGVNEPSGVNGMYWQPDPNLQDTAARAELVTVQKTIFEAVKTSVSPSTLVFTAPQNTFGRPNYGAITASGGWYWVEDLVPAGLLTYADVLAFHSYPTGSDTIQQFDTDLGTAAAWMATNGLGDARKPLVISEYALYGANTTDTPCKHAQYVSQRQFVMAAHGFKAQFPFSWDGLVTTSQGVTAQAVGTGNGSQTVFNLAATSCAVLPFTTSAVSAVYLNGVSQGSGWTFTAPNTLTFSSAPGNGVAVTADYTKLPYGWSAFPYGGGTRNIYGVAQLTVRSYLKGFRALGLPVISGDTMYVDFASKFGKRLRAVWTISGSSTTHTVPAWGSHYIQLDGTDTASSPGSSITIDANPRMILSYDMTAPTVPTNLQAVAA